MFPCLGERREGRGLGLAFSRCRIVVQRMMCDDLVLMFERRTAMCTGKLVGAASHVIQISVSTLAVLIILASVTAVSWEKQEQK